jgi:hypothetical protein
MTTILRPGVALLVAVGGLSSALGEPKGEYRKTVFLVSDSETAPIPKKYRYASGMPLIMDVKGELTTESGADLPAKDYAGFLKDLAESDIGGVEKIPIILAIRVREPSKTSIATIQATVKKLNRVMPTDRDTFICVDVCVDVAK